MEMVKRPNESPAPGPSDRPEYPDTLDHYSDLERWEDLGRQCQRDAAEERRTGVSPAGAHGRLAAFRSLRKRLDRRAR